MPLPISSESIKPLSALPESVPAPKIILGTKFSDEIRRQAANQKIGLSTHTYRTADIPASGINNKIPLPKKTLSFLLNGIRGIANTYSNPESPPTPPSSAPLSKHEYFAELDKWEKTNLGTARGPASSAVRIIKKWIERERPEEPLLLNGLGLRKLPEKLPHNVRRLIINGNQLTRLPLTPHIVELHANNNRLSYLPKEITELPAYSVIYLRNNPLADSVRQSIRKISSEASYQGPRFVFGDGNDLPIAVAPSPETEI